MKYAFSFLAVIAMILIAWVGSLIPGVPWILGVALPYIAFGCFVVMFIMKIVHWAKSPVPFSIQTTCGQGKSLDFIKHDKLEAPDTTAQVVARMFLEIVCFRSLFRNTHSEVHDGPKITYESSKWLWLFAIIFHYSFLVVVIRHLRLFLNPVPDVIYWVEFWDGLFQIGAPTWYMTSLGLFAGAALLFVRRLYNTKVRFISLVNDYFPLVLIFAIATTGILMRYFLHDDIVNIKKLTMALATFSFGDAGAAISAGIGPIFYIHLFLVCALLVYFPSSKLMHMGGVFFSPTRNMKNNSRAVRHINPWNPDIKVHAYSAYEDEFREFMVENGIPVEKELDPAPQEEAAKEE